MQNQRLLFLLIGIMFAVVVCVTGTTIYLLYNAAFEAERVRLVEAVRRNARVIEGMVHMAQESGEPGVQREPLASGVRDKVVQEVLDLYRNANVEGLGRTGDFVIGHREGDLIVILLNQRESLQPLPNPVPFNSGRVEAMRQALLGNAGSLVSDDFGDHRVLAAYAPIPELHLGMVAKVGLPEIRAPFLRAGLVAALAAVLAALAGAALFFRVTNPFVRRLTESEARSREVIDTAADAIITLSSDGRVETINPAAERLFGYLEEEARGHPINLLLPGVFAPRGVEPGAHTPRLVYDALHHSPERELTARRQDGTSFPAEASFRETVIQGRQCFTVVCREITLRKEAEAQIVLAKEQAERSNQAKTEFMAVISHELRTPMNGVLGMNSLLLSTPLNEEQQRYADSVRTSGATLLNIINDILDYSKIEAGMLELEQTDFELVPLVESVVELLHMQAAPKGIELAAFVDPALPPLLRGDPGRLRQVLFNLIGNAIKFTEVGGVTVELRPQDADAGSSDAPTGASVRLRCDVVDTGIGIAAGEGPRLFERFTQADTSTSRRYGGTGLGLAIAKQIVTLMGGEIGFESEPGRGSRFWFTARLEPAGDALPSLPPEELTGLRVLLVDGLDINRAVLRNQLEALGLCVEEVPSGAAAIERFGAATRSGSAHALTLVNNALPDMSGVDLLEALRRMDGGADCRTVLMTAHALRPSPRGEGADPASWRITKPVHLSVLREGLPRLFDPATRVAVRTATQPVPSGSGRGPSDDIPQRILLAEDNPVNQLLAAAYLRKLGHRVDVVANGLDAVAAAVRADYDLILMDVHMPDLDGLEAAARIRARAVDARHDVPIIAITADVMLGDRERFLAAGMNDHIEKPVDFKLLAELVRRWTGQRAQPAGDGLAATERT